MLQPEVDKNVPGTDDDPIERVIEVADWKLFENLSWRLLRLLVQEIQIEQRLLHKDDTFKITDKMDIVYVPTGEVSYYEIYNGDATTPTDHLVRDQAGAVIDPKQYANGSPYRATIALAARGTCKATKDSTVYIFYTRDPPPGYDDTIPWVPSNWRWVTDQSIVARNALYDPKMLKENKPEVVLLTTKDLVEYMPPLTELLAQAMAIGDKSETPQIPICLVRFDPATAGAPKPAPSLTTGTTEHPVDVITVSTLDDLQQVMSGDFTKVVVAGSSAARPTLTTPSVRLSDLRKTTLKLTSNGATSTSTIQFGDRPVADAKALEAAIKKQLRGGDIDVTCKDVAAGVVTVTFKGPARGETSAGGDKPPTLAFDDSARAPLGVLTYDYIFVDPYDRASDLAAVQVKTLTTRARVVNAGAGVPQDLPGTTLTAVQFDAVLQKVNSVVHVSRSFRLELEIPHKLNFFTVVLDSRTARFESGGPREFTELRSADEPMQPRIELPKQDPEPTTRLHLNLMRLKKGWERSPNLKDVCHVIDEPNLPRAGEQGGFWKAKGFFERWSRDLQFRRVGVALGGGGATGFCHVALIRKLREENIPIDLVSGTSFGALAGAYYCSHGLDGLDMLTEQALLLTGLASLTIVTSAFFEHLVNLSIDYRPMWELPIPLYAIATNIETGEMAVFPGPLASNPSVGFAVRASGSLPGLFAPAIAGDLRPVRYLDGSAVSLVPARALVQSGADVVVGSNAFSFRRADASYRPTPLRGFLPPPFGRLAERFLAEINPGNRMLDAARSLSLSLTTAMKAEIDIASAVYVHKRTDVKYWEFHRAAQVLREAESDLVTSSALPAAVNAVRLLNHPVP